MQHLRVVGEFFVRPYESFTLYKGRHMGLSIVLALLLQSPLLFVMMGLMENVGVGLLIVIAILAANVLSTVAILHFISLVFGGIGSWKDMLSLYGFTTLPSFLASAILILGFTSSSLGFRHPTLPTIFTMTNSGLIGYVFFDYAMKLAAYIYSGLAISSVYKLKWTKVVGCILVSIIAGSVISGLFSSSVPFRNVSWKVIPLMIEGIEEVQIGMNSTNSISLKAATLERGEMVLVQLNDTVFIRTVESGSAHFQGEILAELVAVPGDKVTLESGTLLINGEVKYAADKPLPHLSLIETELGEDQYFIYFASPALLGTETNPDQLVINNQQIVHAVPHKMLSFVRWMAR